MALRRDAFQGLVEFVTRINQEFEDLSGEATVWTVGEARLHPNADSIIPGRAIANLQIRDASDDRLNKMMAVARAVAAHVADERQLKFKTMPGASKDAVTLNSDLVDQLANAAEYLTEGNWRRMPSGALHDASNLAHLMPVAMLFVPSIGGISHDFAEDTREEHLVTGLRVLAQAVDGILKC